MNWLDFVLLMVLISGFLYGVKVGLIGALFMTAGVIVGWQIAGHFADDLGAALSGPIAVDTIVTFISYVVILVATAVVFRLVHRLLGPILAVTTSGLSVAADKLGGVVVGAILALFVTGASILGLARLAYAFDVPSSGVAGTVSRTLRLPPTLEVREGLSRGLAGSSFARSFVTVVDNVPGDAIGFAPDDFEVAVLILKHKIDSGQY